MSAARDAFLSGDAQAVCAHLTSRGRALAARLFAYVHDENITTLRGSRRSTEACEYAVRREYSEAQQTGANAAHGLAGYLRASKFAVVDHSGSRANVRLMGSQRSAPQFIFVLRRTQKGWLIHESPNFSFLERIPPTTPSSTTPRGAPPPRPAGPP